MQPLIEITRYVRVMILFCDLLRLSARPRAVHCICCFFGHRRLYEGRADPFSLPEALVVRDEVLVVADVDVQFRYPVEGTVAGSLWQLTNVLTT
jgi:hypothetical protein